MYIYVLLLYIIYYTLLLYIIVIIHIIIYYVYITINMYIHHIYPLRLAISQAKPRTAWPWPFQALDLTQRPVERPAKP